MARRMIPVTIKPHRDAIQRLGNSPFADFIQQNLAVTDLELWVLHQIVTQIAETRGGGSLELPLLQKYTEVYHAAVRTNVIDPNEAVDASLSSYEVQRNKNIIDNQRVMASLGIGQPMWDIRIVKGLFARKGQSHAIDSPRLLLHLFFERCLGMTCGAYDAMLDTRMNPDFRSLLMNAHTSDAMGEMDTLYKITFEGDLASNPDYCAVCAYAVFRIIIQCVQQEHALSETSSPLFLHFCLAVSDDIARTIRDDIDKVTLSSLILCDMLLQCLQAYKPHVNNQRVIRQDDELQNYITSPLDVRINLNQEIIAHQLDDHAFRTEHVIVPTLYHVYYNAKDEDQSIPEMTTLERAYVVGSFPDNYPSLLLSMQQHTKETFWFCN